jgi:hypothetical protein
MPSELRVSWNDIAPRESESISTSTLAQLPPDPAQTQTHTHAPSSTTFEWQNEPCQAGEVFALLERATACSACRMFEYKLQWLHRISQPFPHMHYHCSTERILAREQNIIDLRPHSEAQTFFSRLTALRTSIILLLPLSRHPYR